LLGKRAVRHINSGGLTQIPLTVLLEGGSVIIRKKHVGMRFKDLILPSYYSNVDIIPFEGDTDLIVLDDPATS
jgi:hypothetical protein